MKASTENKMKRISRGGQPLPASTRGLAGAARPTSAVPADNSTDKMAAQFQPFPMISNDFQSIPINSNQFQSNLKKHENTNTGFSTFG